MKIKIATDIHLFGADPTCTIKKVDDLKNHLLLTCDYLIGDIVDFKNCDYNKLQSATTYYNRLKELIGDRYVNGNHEAQGDVEKPYIENGIAFFHGDSICYGMEESILQRSKKHGAGAIERWFKKKFSQGRKLNDFTENDLGKYVVGLRRAFYGYQVHTIVMGHIHPNKLIDAKLPFGRVIVVPRGITEIEI